MTETNRLSFIIRTIDKDLTVLPVGEFIITQINKLKKEMIYLKDLLCKIQTKKNMYILKLIKYKKVKSNG